MREQFSQTKEIGLFIPPAEDSSACVTHYLANKVATELSGVNLRIFSTTQNDDPRIGLSDDLRKAKFLHTSLIEQIVFPFQKKRGLEGNPDGVILCPDLLAEKYKGRVFVEPIQDPNDPDFVARIKDDRKLCMGISIRNLRIFEDGIINAFQQKSDETAFLNIHPAALPEVRGLYGTFWTRMRNHTEYTTTMHVINEKIDAGDILDYEVDRVLDPNAPVMAYMHDVARKTADMIYKKAHLKLVRNGSRPSLTVPQQGEIHYYSAPTLEDIQNGKRRGITFSNPGDQIRWITKNFANRQQDFDHYRELLNALLTQLRNFDKTLDKPELQPINVSRSWPDTPKTNDLTAE